jgi:hypothetical protein
VLLGVRHALVGDTLVRGDVRVEDGRIAAVHALQSGGRSRRRAAYSSSGSNTECAVIARRFHALIVTTA